MDPFPTFFRCVRFLSHFVVLIAITLIRLFCRRRFSPGQKVASQSLWVVHLRGGVPCDSTCKVDLRVEARLVGDTASPLG